MNMGVITKASRDTDVCAMHDMRVRPCAVHQLCQVPSQKVTTISSLSLSLCVRACVCPSSILTNSYDIMIRVGQVPSQRAMILSVVWDQVPSQRAMILSPVWDKYHHKEL
jgi:hypothetical protein